MDDRTMVVNALFRTEAVRVCDPDRPFWYTSGTLGPYYINTHFLFGGEKAAADQLARIESLIREDPVAFPRLLLDDLRQRYASDGTFREVIDAMVRKARGLTVDFVSGGERRDFFFSLLVADQLKMPHLSIFKNGDCVLSDPSFQDSRPLRPDPTGKLSGKRALHVADIVTKAASFTRAWIPVVESFGATMPAALVVIDRKQDGKANLAEAGVALLALVDVDDDLFRSARDARILTDSQLETVRSFNRDPMAYMQAFLAAHPDYIRNELEAGGKARERALLCIENGYASLPADSAR